MGGFGGFKTNYNKKGGGPRQIIIFFSITSVRITFFPNVRVRQEGGMILANLKKSGRVGTWGVKKYLFLGSFFHLMQQPRWITLIYRQGGPGRRGGASGPIWFFLSWGAVGGSKQIRTKKKFSITSIGIFFFSTGRVRQEGDDPVR